MRPVSSVEPEEAGTRSIIWHGEAPQHLVVGDARAERSRPSDGDFRAVAGAARESGIDGAARSRWDTPDESAIAGAGAGHRHRGWRTVLQAPRCALIRLCHHQQAVVSLSSRCTMPGSLYPADPRKACSAMRNQRIDECAGGMPRSRVHGKAFRFVDHDEVGVLMHDNEGDGLRCKRSWGSGAGKCSS